MREQIEIHARKDFELYEAALDVFWRRVAVMEEVTGERFHDLPGEENRMCPHVCTCMCVYADTRRFFLLGCLADAYRQRATSKQSVPEFEVVAGS